MDVFNESRWAEEDLADCWCRRRGGEGKFDFRMGKRMSVKTIELDMPVRAARAGIIMKLSVRLALQRRGEQRVCHSPVDVSKISVGMLHFRMDVDPR